MSDQDSLPTGELETEVLQEDTEPTLPLAPVPVSVAGPVAVQNVPSRAGASFNRLLLAADVPQVPILPADPRRRIARLICGQAFSIGSDQASVTQLVAALWPANVVCEITHAEPVWVDVAADAAISVMVENWAD